MIEWHLTKRQCHHDDAVGRVFALYMKDVVSNTDRERHKLSIMKFGSMPKARQQVWMSEILGDGLKKMLQVTVLI